MLDNLELYLAAASLKNKRYSAAFEQYSKVNARNESAEAMLGMCFCKLYQMAEGITINEVIEYFNKAKLIDPTLQAAIDEAFIRRCQIVKIAYVNFYNEALQQQIRENKIITPSIYRKNQTKNKAINSEIVTPKLLLNLEQLKKQKIKVNSSIME